MYSMGTWSTPILFGSRLGVDTRCRSPPPISILDSIHLAFMLVRLLVLTVAALIAFNMMHSYLDGCVLGNGKHAPAFGPDPVTQGLLRLGSGADIYPRTTRSLRADTLAPTAPPYIYGGTFLGYARPNTRHKPCPEFDPWLNKPESRTGRHWNGGTMVAQSTLAPVDGSITKTEKARFGWSKGSKSSSSRSRRQA